MVSEQTSVHVLLIGTVHAETDSLAVYLKRHNMAVSLSSSLAEGLERLSDDPPDVIVVAGSDLESPSICRFGLAVEKVTAVPIVAMLTEVQNRLVTELAESGNLWVIEYPVQQKELRLAIYDAMKADTAAE